MKPSYVCLWRLHRHALAVHAVRVLLCCTAWCVPLLCVPQLCTALCTVVCESRQTCKKFVWQNSPVLPRLRLHSCKPQQNPRCNQRVICVRQGVMVSGGCCTAPVVTAVLCTAAAAVQPVQLFGLSCRGRWVEGGCMPSAVVPCEAMSSATMHVSCAALGAAFGMRLVVWGCVVLVHRSGCMATDVTSIQQIPMTLQTGEMGMG